jgi:hypothetical protein
MPEVKLVPQKGLDALRIIKRRAHAIGLPAAVLSLFFQEPAQGLFC